MTAYLYVWFAFSSTNKCVVEHESYLCINNLVYGLGVQSMPSLPIISNESSDSERSPYVFKIVYKICCGIDVHKTFVVACIASTNDKGITSYESHRFSTYTSGMKLCYNGYSTGIARMSVWNLPVNTGFLFITS